MENENLDELKSNLNKSHDSLTGKENQGNHFIVEPPTLSNPVVTNAVQQSQVHNSLFPQNQNMPPIAPIKKPIDKEKLIKIGIITGSIGLLVFLSWFGYRWYQRSSDERILKEAAKNLISTRDLHSKATIGVDAFSLKFDLFVDRDQDMKATVNVNLMGDVSAEGLWFPSKDNAYIGTSYNYNSIVEGDDPKDQNKMSYTELTNVKKTLEKYENEFALTDALNPTKDFFTGENLKYVKREGTDTIDGKKLHKFSFKPTNDYINEKIKKATKDKELPFILQKSDIAINFWISDSDLKISKIDGKILIKTESSDSEKKKSEERKQKCIAEENDYSSSKSYCDYLANDNYKQEFSLNWNQEFIYDFKDDIIPPKAEDVKESVDVYKELDQGYQNDKTKISDLKDIQDALKDYKKDNGYYPKALYQLKTENKKSDYTNDYEYSDPYLYSIPDSPDSNKYEYKTEGSNIQSYTLTVKLAAPEYYEESEYLKNGVLTLTEKNSNFYLKEKVDKNGSNSSSQVKAMDSMRKSSLKSIYTSLTNYADDNNGEYPTSLNELSPDYMSEIPKDPTTGKDYAYSVSASKTEFELNANLENKNDNDDNNDGGNSEDTYEVGDDPGLNLI